MAILQFDLVEDEARYKAGITPAANFLSWFVVVCLMFLPVFRYTESTMAIKFLALLTIIVVSMAFLLYVMYSADYGAVRKAASKIAQRKMDKLKSLSPDSDEAKALQQQIYGAEECFRFGSK